MRIPAHKIVALPIRFYRYAISPLFGSSCRFHPTCSVYALEALEQHGAIKGIWLTVKRIGKCQPYCTAEWYDPVPKEFTRQDVFGYKRRHNKDKEHQSRKAPTK